MATTIQVLNYCFRNLTIEATSARLGLLAIRCVSSSSTSTSRRTVQATNALSKDRVSEAVSKAVQTEDVLDLSSYKVVEYFNNNPMSFYDLDCEMTAKRNPQPSSK